MTIRLTTKTQITDAGGFLTREAGRIFSALFDAVGGSDGLDKVADAKADAATASAAAAAAQSDADAAQADADTAQATADAVAGVVADPVTGLAATKVIADGAKVTADAVTATVNDATTGLAATNAIADVALERADFALGQIATTQGKLSGLTAYTAATISNPPTQAEVQAIADALAVLVAELKA